VLAPIDELEKALARLPGFGRRSSARAALALVREPGRLLEPLAAALDAARRRNVPSPSAVRRTPLSPPFPAAGSTRTSAEGTPLSSTALKITS